MMIKNFKLHWIVLLASIISDEASGSDGKDFDCLKFQDNEALPYIGIHFEPYNFLGNENKSISRMLEIIADRGFRRISTYPIKNTLNTFRKAIVESAIEFNAMSNTSRQITVYPVISAQASVFHTTIQEVISLINKTLESQAPETLGGVIIYTKGTDSETHLSLLKSAIKNVSTDYWPGQTVPTLGVSSKSCKEDLENQLSSNGTTIGLLMHIDFLICQKLANEDNDPVTEAKEIVDYFKATQTKLDALEGVNVKVIGMTGWKSRWIVNEDRNGIEGRESFRKFWCQIDKRSNELNISIQMYHAFERPKSVDEESSINLPVFKIVSDYGWWLPIMDKDTGAINFQEKVNYEEIPEIPLREIVTGISAAVVFIILAITISILYYKLRTAKSLLSEKEIEEFRKGILEARTDINDHTEDALKLPYDNSFEIPKSKFHIDYSVLLGKGAFGLVYRGRVDGYEKEVAIKKTAADITAPSFKNMLSEIKIMIYVGKHPNIVSIIGAHTGDIRRGDLYIALEICELGSLEGFLKKFRAEFLDNTAIDSPSVQGRQCPFQQDNETATRYTAGPTLMQKFATASPETILAQLHKWAYGIANGMEHIASKHIIHSDLAARNVLLTSDKTVKITDFGLSRRLYEYTEYTKCKENQGPLPWRWMAIETLEDMTFSTKSDVWSYGVTMYELFSFGHIPYPGYTWTTQFISDIKCGSISIPQPEYASNDIYQLMKQCWEINPKNRPEFTTIKKILSELIQNVDDHVYRQV